MSSLRQLLAAHESLLVLDAASARIQVGWITRDATRWHASSDEAGIGLFRAIEALGIRPIDAAAYVFCDGPGSILGVRSAAMAIRAWRVLAPRPVYAYASLALVAHAAQDPRRAMIADARRESWHHFRLGEPLRRVAAAELSGPLAMPEHFRHWSPLPAGVALVPYAVDALLAAAADADLFTATEHPDAFLHEEPSYVTWTPQIHRVPAPS